MSKQKVNKEEWLFEITPKNNLLSLNLNEVWKYRDLLMLFVKRDIITVYKQTILGPIWYLIQPIFTALIFTLIFNKIANIETGTVPAFLFNMAGITTWNYFKNCLQATSNTFGSNAGIFAKVYFPRIVMPISSVITNLLRFGIQLLGMIISSLVTKYRDLKYLLNFGVQLLMYVSAVMYPLALVQDKLPKYAWLVEYNPLAYIVESSRYMLLSDGTFTMNGLLYTGIVSVIILFFGIIIFNKTEKNFIDTV